MTCLLSKEEYLNWQNGQLTRKLKEMQRQRDLYKSIAETATKQLEELAKERK